jgi:mTERF domain-containing protein
MTISEKKITKIMNFFLKYMGLTQKDIARMPGILMRSFERIIVPRCEVVKILKSRGLIKSDLLIGTFITISEKTFLARYVTPFQKDLQLLLDVYKGQKSE